MANATPPPPPDPPHGSPSASNHRDLPPSSVFPVLASTQFRYSMEDAVRDLPQVPRFLYRVKLHLNAEKGATFADAPWTLMVRRFFHTLKTIDPNVIILRRRDDAGINKISSHEEIPTDINLFERDYAYDVKVEKSFVQLKLLIATMQGFTQTFKTGRMFTKLKEKRWFVSLDRLETQGNTVVIGHLSGAHNRFANQDDLIQSLQRLIAPTTCTDIDIIISQPYRTITNSNGKKERIHTRWPSITCPADMAAPLTELLLDKWPTLDTDEGFNLSNLRNYTFLPTGKSIVNFSTTVQHMINQNEFLFHYNQVTVLYNCENMDSLFALTPEMATSLGSQFQVNDNISLRQLLFSWTDNDESVIYAIDRSYEQGSFTLLSHKRHAAQLRRHVNTLVKMLRSHALFSDITTGGNSGPRRANLDVSSAARSYLDSITTTNQYQSTVEIERIPSTDSDDAQIQQQRAQGWKSPPSPSARSLRKPISQPPVVDPTKHSTTMYRDILTENDFPSLPSTHATSSTSLALRAKNNNKAPPSKAITSKTMETAALVSVKNFMSSDDFTTRLSQVIAPLIAPQVSQIIQPTIQQVQNLEHSIHRHSQQQHHWETTMQQQNNDISQLRQDVSTLLSMMSRYTSDLTNTTTQKRVSSDSTPISSPSKIPRVQPSPPITPPRNSCTDNTISNSPKPHLRPGTSLGIFSSPTPPSQGNDVDMDQVTSPMEQDEGRDES